MKMIKVMLKPERFQFVKKALEDNEFVSMTITEVKGRGEQKGISLAYRGGYMTIDMLQKIQIEMVVKEKDVDAVVKTLSKSAYTGSNGDGRIFISPVETAIRIRTGEMEALL